MKRGSFLEKILKTKDINIEYHKIFETLTPAIRVLSSFPSSDEDENSKMHGNQEHMGTPINGINTKVDTGSGTRSIGYSFPVFHSQLIWDSKALSVNLG
jgi:hypothetical protein